MPEHIPEGSVVITPAEQWSRTSEQFGAITEKLDDLRRDVSPLPAQVAEHDAFINSLREVGLPGSMTKIQTEVTRIDRVQVKGLGIAAAIGASGGVLAAIIPALVKLAG